MLRKKGRLQDLITQFWVKTTGKTLSSEEFEWLNSPFGDVDEVGDRFIDRIAKEKQLKVESNKEDFGLLNRIEDFGLSEGDLTRLNPKIIDFYTKTINYNFEIWSTWTGIFRPFGWLLSRIFSRRLRQLNLPLSPMDASQGIESNIIKLKSEKEVFWTIWYRILRSTRQVIYSGIYSATKIPNQDKIFLKVAFPLPNGAAVVVMKIKVKDNGSLLLISDGKRYGDAGFYFTLRRPNDKNYSVRFVRSMHETIHVYEDNTGILRTDHLLNFSGIRFLTLHYKIVPR